MSNRSDRQGVDNISSILLNKAENDAVFGCLGRGCCTMATGVVQLFLAGAPSTQKWTRKHCGVVCFTKDNPRRCFFIRLYDIKKKELLWEQELYLQFVYKTPREYFHTFEADNCQAALNFASEDEAATFKKAIEGKLLERQRKRLERKQKKQQSGATSPTPRTNQAIPTGNTASGPPPASHAVSTGRPTPAPAATSSKDKDKDKGKRKKLTKEDISTPTDFRHISHVGWDPNKGLDMQKLDPEMKALFETIGIDDQSIVDEETIDFIYDFVDQHGGLDAVKKDLAKRKPPAPVPTHTPAHSHTVQPAQAPAYTPPPPPMRQTGGAPPPPPARVGVAPPPRPGRVGMALPPPPPPGPRQPMGGPPPPPPNTRQAAPPPPPINNAPVAPPPPPAAPMAPPPPLMPGPPVGGGQVRGGPPLPPVDTVRGGLLDQIHKGATLRSVETNAPHSGGDARTGLLDQIRTGTSLKPVDHHADAPATSEGIVGALAQALAMRKGVIQGSDDDSDSDDDIDDDSDEWSD